VKRALTIAAALAALICAAPAAAQDKKPPRQPDQYGAEDKIDLDPQRAYIFFRSQYRTNYRFLRDVSPAQRAEHAARRAEAFAKARRRYERQLRAWERKARECGPRNVSSYCQGHSQRPVEVTEANFAFNPPELDNFVGNAFKPRLEFADDNESGWLIAVEPGTYTIYGAIAESPNGLAGGCFCMGSVRFEARPGVITNLGEIRDDITQAEAFAFAKANGNNAFRLGHGIVTPPDAQKPLPPQLAGLNVVPAELHAADKMPNYFGVFISRLAPIPGVLRYDRDVVIDDRTGRPVAEAAPAVESAATP